MNSNAQLITKGELDLQGGYSSWTNNWSFKRTVIECPKKFNVRRITLLSSVMVFRC